MGVGLCSTQESVCKLPYAKQTRMTSENVLSAACTYLCVWVCVVGGPVDWFVMLLTVCFAFFFYILAKPPPPRAHKRSRFIRLPPQTAVPDSDESFVKVERFFRAGKLSGAISSLRVFFFTRVAFSSSRSAPADTLMRGVWDIRRDDCLTK